MSAARPTTVSVMVAMAKNDRAFGLNGKLPWPRLHGELPFFKATTMGKPIIMGRKTFDSIGRRLPGRLNIVISRSADFRVDDAEVKIAATLEEALNLSKDFAEAFIIGGAELISYALDSEAVHVDRLLVTEVDGDFAGDVFLPPIDPAIWTETSRNHNPIDGERSIAFDFVEYRRIEHKVSFTSGAQNV